MKKLKTQKLGMKTETVRSLTDKQQEQVVGGYSVVQSQTNDTARCQITYQIG